MPLHRMASNNLSVGAEALLKVSSPGPGTPARRWPALVVLAPFSPPMPCLLTCVPSAQAGASVDARTQAPYSGETPLDIALASGNRQVAELLARYGARR